MTNTLRRTSILALIAAASLPLHASDDWPQWRGPARTGLVPAADAPAQWPATLTKGWSVAVGEGYSSPVAASGRVFVHARVDPDEVISALDINSGKVIWEAKYPAPFAKNPYAKQMAKGPYSTPLVADGRLYTLGTTGMLSAWDAGTGKLLWRHDHSQKVDSSKLFCGTAVSPIRTARGIVILVGDDRGANVITYDPASGKEVWSRAVAGAGYASPIEMQLGGTTQIVTMTTKSVVGLDSNSGGILWEFPFNDEWNENIVTPVATPTGVIVSGVRQGTRALNIAKAAQFELQKRAPAEHLGYTWRVTEAWHTPDVTMYMSTPVLVDKVLFGHSTKRKGQFVAVDPGSGKILWSTEGRGGQNASVTAAGNHLLFLTNDSELLIAQIDPSSYKEVRRYTVASSPIWAQPILLRDKVIVRDATNVTVWHVK
jgi:outer membrane protein assembly factor BamB